MLTTTGFYIYGFFAGLLIGTFSVVGLWFPAYISLSFSINPPHEGQSIAMRFFQRFTGIFFASCFGTCAIWVAVLAAELSGALLGYGVALIGFFYSSINVWLKNRRVCRSHKNRY